MKKIVKFVIGGMFSIAILFGISGCSQIAAEDCLEYETTDCIEVEEDNARYTRGRHGGNQSGNGTGTNTSSFIGM